MATSLFKLVMSATTNTTTDTNPEVEQYFYRLDPADRTGDTLTIPSTSFTDSGGVDVTSNIVTAATDNGYYLLFINGALQETSLFTVGAAGSNVVITQTSLVPISAPITLVVNNFDPSSTSTTTVTS